MLTTLLVCHVIIITFDVLAGLFLAVLLLGLCALLCVLLVCGVAADTPPLPPFIAPAVVKEKVKTSYRHSWLSSSGQGLVQISNDRLTNYNAQYWCTVLWTLNKDFSITILSLISTLCACEITSQWSKRPRAGPEISNGGFGLKIGPFF